VVVCGATVKPRQELPRLGRYDSNFIIFARKRSNGIYRIKPHYRDELYAIINIATKQVYAAVTLD
jgi:hypothetical protein